MISIVTLKDIFTAVRQHISDVTEMPVEDSDLEEPVVRPSFKIFMNTVYTGFYSSALRQARVYFNIYFYAKDRKHSKAEIMDIADKIAFSFLEPFRIKEECAVYIDDLEFEKVEDGIMNCSFDFEIATEFIDEAGIETMYELELRRNYNGNKTNRNHSV